MTRSACLNLAHVYVSGYASVCVLTKYVCMTYIHACKFVCARARIRAAAPVRAFARECYRVCARACVRVTDQHPIV